MSDHMLQAALHYAALGLPVLPLHTPRPTGCSCGRDCGSPGKHPRSKRGVITQGLHEATTDPATIRRWWAIWPDANIGLRTGEVADVCDIDSPSGLQALRDLLAEHRILGPTVRTGSGGWHLYVQPTGHGNRVNVLPGVDWRGRDGYVVAPPSLHHSGTRYQWHRAAGTVAIPECPPPLHNLLTPPEPTPATTGPVRHLSKYAEAAIAAEVQRVLTAPAPHGQGTNRVPGGRNAALNKAAYNLGRLVAGGALDEHDAITALTTAGLDARLMPFEVRRTIASGMRAGARKPRHPETRGAR